MGILNGIKKDPIGSANNANDIKGVADGVRDAGINAVNSNQVETAKSLSGTLLTILGILTPMPGGGNCNRCHWRGCQWCY